DVFEGEPAVATHHDYTPRNWILDPVSGEWLGVIDFEHACFDVCVADFKLHHDRYFAERPDLRDAFFAGYGSVLSERQQAQLRLIHLHQAVSGVVWAREHGDADFAATNAAILSRLRRE
ncbi:MAG: phosphotransferase, partial [Armatimonadetes bacterium]|nr:phosphotransferase [Armatimonadota bacterium]